MQDLQASGNCEFSGAAAQFDFNITGPPPMNLCVLNKQLTYQTSPKS